MALSMFAAVVAAVIVVMLVWIVRRVREAFPSDYYINERQIREGYHLTDEKFAEWQSRADFPQPISKRKWVRVDVLKWTLTNYHD